MITIKKETNKGQGFIHAYKMSSCESIYDAYKTPSFAKCSSFQNCVDLCNRENGHGLKITGAGTYCFIVAWLTDAGLRVETACNSYLIA